MEATVPLNWMSRFWSYVERPWLYHLLLWLLYFNLMLTINYNGWAELPFTLKTLGIHLFFVMALVYWNLWQILPQYLAQKKIGRYFLMATFATFLITPLELIFLYWVMDEYTAAQEHLLKNQHIHFLFNFFVLSLSTALKIGKEWLRQERIKRDLEKRNLQSELSFLKSQINPHFLFNTLNNLYALSLKKSDKAPELVLRLSAMMRYMLYECNEKMVPLQKEISYMENYLALEQIRYGDKAQIALHYPQPLPQSVEVPPLLFIPFLENAFKHGLSNSIEEGYVWIELQIEEKKLNFRIENSKSSEPKGELYHQGGIGLSNVRRRLELLYPKRHQLQIMEDPSSYQVLLTLTKEEL